MGQFCEPKDDRRRVARKFYHESAFTVQLMPYIESKTTIMRSPVDVLKQVAVTLSYLSDEGRLRKTANAFGLSRQVVSKIICKVCKAISIYLGAKYITLPFTEKEVEGQVKKFSPIAWFPSMFRSS